MFFLHFSLYLVFPARAPSNLTVDEILLGIEPGDGRTAGEQAGYQLALLASTLFIAGTGGLFTGKRKKERNDCFFAKVFIFVIKCKYFDFLFIL